MIDEYLHYPIRVDACAVCDYRFKSLQRWVLFFEPNFYEKLCSQCYVWARRMLMR